MLKIEGGLDRRQLNDLKRELARRDLPPRKRQRLLWRIARHGIIAAAKRNQRQQQSPEGAPWPGRRRGKQKMLRGLPKLLAVREMPEREAVVVYLRSQGGRALSAGVLGAIHAQGATTTVNAAALPTPAQSGPATRKQASALRKLGYQRREGGRWVRASASWVVQNLSRAQAGLIIRKLSGETPKSTWKIVLPARAFLGVSDAEFNRIMARQLQAIDFGWQVSAQDIKGKNS
ncbi:TPA: hypothetical protein ACS3AC_000962 [Klebsiella pneumoniae]|nr:hypothetical protein [Klebsiella pneumoniae]HDY4998478.1 hypothetical protein [Klebsiella pneumoniae]